MGKGEVARCHVEVQVHRRATVCAAKRNPQITQHSVAHGQRLPTKHAGSAARVHVHWPADIPETAVGLRQTASSLTGVAS